jgi:hypothetical protein
VGGQRCRHEAAVNAQGVDRYSRQLLSQRVGQQAAAAAADGGQAVAQVGKGVCM